MVVSRISINTARVTTIATAHGLLAGFQLSWL
jgi:hypothetical protein